MHMLLLILAQSVQVPAQSDIPSVRAATNGVVADDNRLTVDLAGLLEDDPDAVRLAGLDAHSEAFAEQEVDAAAGQGGNLAVSPQQDAAAAATLLAWMHPEAVRVDADRE